jgi:hypothetical protein
MLNLIRENKEITKLQLISKFTENIQDVITDIENLLNNTVNAINSYNTHFDTFQIPNEVADYLNNFVFNEIKPKYYEIQDIIDHATKDLIISNLEKNSQIFKNTYATQNYKSKVEEINNNLTDLCNKVNEYLESYGLTEDKYAENLEKEIIRYQRIRRLDDLDSDKKNYNEKVDDIKIEKTFSQLKDNSLSLKEFFNSLNLFNEFDEKIKKYINDINYSYAISKNRTEKFKEYYDNINEKLQELYQLSIQYYNSANFSFYNIKELIKNFINKIDKNIENSANITYNSLSNEYIKIKDKFKTVNIKDQNTIQKSIPENSITATNDKIYFIASTISNLLVENEFNLDIVLEKENFGPLIVGNITNKNRPEKLEIDFYTKTGNNCGKIGRRITILFNNISLLSNFSFNWGDNNLLIDNVLDADEYEIKTENYEIKEKGSETILFGIPFNNYECEESEGKTEREIIASKKDKTNKEYIY